MSIYRKKQWYVASIGGLSAYSQNRLEAMRLAIAMFSLNPPLPSGRGLG
jgi:hypothetical protein